MAGDEAKMKKYLFVCGCARSGTTALVEALNTHPEIAIGMERFIHIFNAGIPDSSLFEPSRFFKFMPGDTFYNDIRAMSGNPSSEKFGRATYVGDKVPRLFRRFDKLFEVFPGAKILFLLRSPLSVAASWERRSKDTSDNFWSRGRDAISCIQEYNESLQSVIPHLNSDRILIVPYERIFFDGYGWDRISKFLDLKSNFPIKPKSRVMSKISELNVDISSAVRDGIKWGLYEEVAASIHRGAKHDHYSEADSALISYGSTPVPGFSIAVRDPSRNDIICLGSAATFGRFVKSPYPKRIGASNFGIGGARPESFLHEPVAIARIAKAKSTVIEVMSARGYTNAAFSPVGRFSNMVSLTSEYREDPEYSHLPERFFVDRFWQLAFRTNNERAIELAKACQETWLRDMKDLLRFSKKPIILWFSQNAPCEEFTGIHDYKFPHFITRNMIKQLDAKYVEVVSTVGMPYRLVNDRDEAIPVMKGWPDPTINSYYPSQEMHNLAAAMLKERLARRR